MPPTSARLHPASLALVAIAGLFGLVSTAAAHFIYIIPPEPGQKNVQVVFGEGPAPADSNKLLSYLDGITLKANGEQTIELSPGKGAVTGEASDMAVLSTSKTVGVMSRGEDTFRLEYGAKAGTALGSWSWGVDTDLTLDVMPTLNDDGSVTVAVTFEGEPVAGAEVIYDSESVSDSLETDEKGKATISDLALGIVAVRAKHVVQESGSLDEKDYDQIRYYTTLTFRHTGDKAAPSVLSKSSGLPDLPVETTSFGATQLGDMLYMYGGHSGSAHSYSREEQNDTLWTLDTSKSGAEWSAAIKGEPLQGNALVTVGDRVVLLGGFTAHNAAGEDHDLHSLPTVRAYSPGSDSWTELPDMPEPRSSFDADVIGETIYVAGGWSMQGDADAVWHDTAWKLDLSADSPSWQPLADVPSPKRAISFVAHNGALYLLGGMTESNGPTTSVFKFDPAADAWTTIAPLPGTSMNGFGCEGISTDGSLFVTTYDGAVHRLDGDDWATVGQLAKKRFFHRIVPSSKSSALILGGGDMSVGKYVDVESLQLAN